MTSEAHPATTGQPIDLDVKAERAERTITRLEESVHRLEANPIAGPLVGLLMEARIALADVPRLVTELRASRDLRKQVGHYLAMFNATPELRSAVAAYDQAVGGEA